MTDDKASLLNALHSLISDWQHDADNPDLLLTEMQSTALRLCSEELQATVIAFA